MRHSKYPSLSSLANIRNLPDGAIVFVKGMQLSRFQDVYHLYDGEVSLPVTNIPKEWKDRIDSSQGSGLLGVDMHILVYYVTDYDYYANWRSKIEYKYYEPKPSKCTCGAAHTFMPHHHSNWCDSHTWE